LLDERVGGGVLERRGRELIGIVVAEVKALGRGEPGIILRPGLNLAFGVVGVILLRDQVVVVRALQVLDLLEPLVGLFYARTSSSSLFARRFRR
jgi:hypothetical protein